MGRACFSTYAQDDRFDPCFQNTFLFLVTMLRTKYILSLSEDVSFELVLFNFLKFKVIFSCNLNKTTYPV